jgi:hypothetical protein
MRTRRDRAHAAILGVLVFVLIIIPMFVQLVIYLFKMIF